MVIVSNRLPIVLEEVEGQIKIKPGSGGLVTALEPVLRHRGRIWIGWPGHYDHPEQVSDQLAHLKKDFIFSPVFLAKEEVDLFYHGFSNGVVWPLFHDLPIQCQFLPQYWQAYKEVNQKYAEAIVKQHRKGDFVWVHDYQLMCVGEELRKRGMNIELSFFLYIPFPPLDIFLKLPWRTQLLKALLQYDLIGFQTLRDRRNFIQCMKTLIKEAHFKSVILKTGRAGSPSAAGSCNR